MLLRSVPGLAACPQTCCIHRCFGTRSGPAARVPDRLSSRNVWPRTSSYISCLLLPRSRPLLRQVPLDGDVVVPTAFLIGTRWKAAGLRSRMQHDLRVPACNGRVPALHGRTVPVPVHSCLPNRQLGHPGPIRSKRMARPSPLLPVCLTIAILRLVRPPRHLSLASRPPKAALCEAVGCRPHLQLRQSSCGAVVGSPTNELRPALAVRPPQSHQSRTCARPRHSPARQCSAHTLDGRPILRSRTYHTSPWCRHTPHMAFAGCVAEKVHRARPRPRPAPLSSLRLVSSLPLPAPWSPPERAFEL